MKSLCVYCGSSLGASPGYAHAARMLAKVMAGERIALIYGGAKVGLMGVIADEVLRLGGEVAGVIPQSLAIKEVAHPGLTRLHVVDSMHERKTLMAQLADGFVALPGGIGTLEELFETFTWLQLGFHRKPVGLLNVQGYYAGLIRFLDHSVGERFLSPEDASRLVRETDPVQLVHRLRERWSLQSEHDSDLELQPESL